MSEAKWSEWADFCICPYCGEVTFEWRKNAGDHAGTGTLWEEQCEHCNKKYQVVLNAIHRSRTRKSRAQKSKEPFGATTVDPVCPFCGNVNNTWDDFKLGVSDEGRLHHTSCGQCDNFYTVLVKMIYHFQIKKGKIFEGYYANSNRD